MKTRATLLPLSVATKEFEVFHVRQHSNMLIVSPKRCIRRRLSVCVECTWILVVFPSKMCCYLLLSTEYKAGEAMLLGDGI